MELHVIQIIQYNNDGKLIKKPSLKALKTPPNPLNHAVVPSLLLQPIIDKNSHLQTLHNNPHHRPGSSVSN